MKYIILVVMLLLSGCVCKAPKEIVIENKKLSDVFEVIHLSEFKKDVNLTEGLSIDLVGNSKDLLLINSLDTMYSEQFGADYFYAKEFLVLNTKTKNLLAFDYDSKNRIIDFTYVNGKIYAIVESFKSSGNYTWSLDVIEEGVSKTIFSSDSSYVLNNPPSVLEYDNSFIILDQDFKTLITTVYKYDVDKEELIKLDEFMKEGFNNFISFAYVEVDELVMMFSSDEKTIFYNYNLDTSTLNKNEINEKCSRGVIVDGNIVCAEYEVVYEVDDIKYFEDNSEVLNNIIVGDNKIITISDSYNISINFDNKRIEYENDNVIGYCSPKIVYIDNNIYIFGAIGDKGEAVIYKVKTN